MCAGCILQPLSRLTFGCCVYCVQTCWFVQAIWSECCMHTWALARCHHIVAVCHTSTMAHLSTTSIHILKVHYSTVTLYKHITCSLLRSAWGLIVMCLCCSNAWHMLIVPSKLQAWSLNRFTVWLHMLLLRRHRQAGMQHCGHMQ
jgi:hypothetical protein